MTDSKTVVEDLAGAHWNYRLTVQSVDDNEAWEVREIYYDADGEVSRWSVDAVAALGDSWTEVADDLSRMVAATGHAAFDLDAKQWVDHKRNPVERQGVEG